MIYIMPASYPNRRFLPATLEFYGLLQSLLPVPSVQHESQTDRHIGGIFLEMPGAAGAIGRCTLAELPCPGAYPGASILRPGTWGKIYPVRGIGSGSRELNIPGRLWSCLWPSLADIAAVLAAIRPPPTPAPIGAITAHSVTLQPGPNWYIGRPSSRTRWGAIPLI